MPYSIYRHGARRLAHVLIAFFAISWLSAQAGSDKVSGGGKNVSNKTSYRMPA